jgi:hypothetical protein
VNTSEHTKTTIDGGRNGGQNHSLAKRIGGETNAQHGNGPIDEAATGRLLKVGNDESSDSVAHLGYLGLGAGLLIMCLTYRVRIDERVLAMFDLCPQQTSNFP